MNKLIKGYYFKKEKLLLDDFDKTIEMVRNTEKFGREITDSLKNEFILEYKKIIPEIPYFKGYRQKMFNGMYLITGQIIAVYRVFTKYGKKPEEIWEICHKALSLKLKKIPQCKKWFAKKAWHSVFGRMIKRRGRLCIKETLGYFEIEYLASDGDSYDFGINYTKCGHFEFLKQQKAEEMFPYVCLADIILSDIFGWGLIRTQTIGDGCDYCDFRFKKGANTQVTSKNSQVQKMINK